MSIIKLNNRSVKDVSAFGSITGLGNLVFIKKLTASTSSSLSFVHGSSSVILDNTYKEYIFYFLDIHPSNDQSEFGFNASIDGGSNYNVAKTTTAYYNYNRGSDGHTDFGYRSGQDLANSTSDQIISFNANVDNYSSGSGILHLFSPSDTTFVKHFICETHSDAQTSAEQGLIQSFFSAGYINSTSAVNALTFKFSSGNIDAGDILLFGLN